ncbi:MAG: hypothetical protein OJF61_002773 [Rhodanobacteraceae bacterium]|nr:MAG: hypothetical protein OJF61_002773 [Rhodanobacteraceae bacterium]
MSCNASFLERVRLVHARSPATYGVKPPACKCRSRCRPLRRVRASAVSNHRGRASGAGQARSASRIRASAVKELPLCMQSRGRDRRDEGGAKHASR